MPSDFRFAIMGAGKIARRFCDAVSLVEGCTVCAVASKSMDRAAQLAAEKGIPAAYDSYEKMLIAEQPDCVYISP
ncbi:MAG: Gfo/Idh/MocA family oxidoreductase, partial [Clostridia bacterium]|nr:Gfo/Idh/MocA family oxidoreductase [Clostridia bacterium]